MLGTRKPVVYQIEGGLGDSVCGLLWLGNNLLAVKEGANPCPRSSSVPTRLAADLADRLLRPGVLNEGLRSGLFLSGLGRTGKTTFLRIDLVPELEAREPW